MTSEFVLRFCIRQPRSKADRSGRTTDDDVIDEQRPAVRTHLSAFAARQSCDVAEVRDAAQLVGHGHQVPLPGGLLTLRDAQTHHHRLLVVFPVKIAH